MITIQQYQILVAIHEEGQLTKVANRLGLSQPTITFHIKKLEENCQLAIIEQRGRRAILTPTAQLLLPLAKEILKLHHQTQQFIHDLQHQRQGSVTIGASNSVATYMIPHALPLIFENFPKSDIKIQVHNARTILKKIMEYDLDLGLIVAHHSQLDGLHAIPIKDDPIGIIMRSDHPLSTYPFQDPSVIVNERILLREEDSTSTKTFRKWCHEWGITCEKEMEIQSPEAIKRAVLAQAGIAVVSRISVEEEINSGRILFKEIARNERRSIYLIHHPNRPLSPLQQALSSMFIGTFSI